MGRREKEKKKKKDKIKRIKKFTPHHSQTVHARQNALHRRHEHATSINNLVLNLWLPGFEVGENEVDFGEDPRVADCRA